MKNWKLILCFVMIIIMIALVALGLSGCNKNAGYNKQFFDFNYKYTNAYIKIGDEWKDVKIKAWTDYEDGDQLQLVLEDDTVLLVHSMNCILYIGTLPYKN